MDAEHLERGRDHPVLERRFFEVGDSVQAGRHPVAGIEHVAGDLRLDRVHVVHERGRADDAAQKNDRRDQKNDQAEVRRTTGIA